MARGTGELVVATGLGSNTIFFEQVYDKRIPSNIKSIKWCPTMDLLAIVVAAPEEAIWIYRLSWQRLWSLGTPEKIPVKAISWSPDGKLLAASYENNQIILWNIESGEPFSFFQHPFLTQSPVYSLEWFQQQLQQPQDDFDDQMLSFDRTPTLFPPFKAFPDKTTVFANAQKTEKSNEDIYSGEYRVPQLNVLLQINAQNHLLMTAFGQLLIGEVDIEQTISTALPTLKSMTKKTVVLASSLTSDLQKLSLVCEITTTESTITRKYTVLLTYTTATLFNRSTELSIVASYYHDITRLVNQIESLLKKMETDWREAKTEWNSKFEQLRKMITDDGRTASLQEEFLSLLTHGAMTPSLENFLVNFLKEQGLKKLTRSIESVFCQIQEIVIDYLRCDIELLMFKVSQLGALSCWEERFESVGIHEHSVVMLLQLVGNLMSETERFLKTVVKKRQLYLNFLQWLSREQQLLSEEKNKSLPVVNFLQVLNFLKEDLVFDTIEHFFADKLTTSSESPFEFSHFVWETKSSPSTLKQLCCQLHSANDNIFQCVCNKLSASFHLDQMLTLCQEQIEQNGPSSTSLPSRHLSFYTPKTVLLNQSDICKQLQYLAIFVSSRHSHLEMDSMWLVKYFSTSNNESSQQWIISGFYLSPQYNLVDFSFYKDNTLLLLQASREDRTMSMISLVNYGDTLTWKFASTNDINTCGGIVPFFRKINNFPPFTQHQHEIQQKARVLPKTEVIGIYVSGVRGIGSVLAVGTPLRLMTYDFEAESESPHNEGERQASTGSDPPEDEKDYTTNNSNVTNSNE
jgi:hypothetical protein